MSSAKGSKPDPSAFVLPIFFGAQILCGLIATGLLVLFIALDFATPYEGGLVGFLLGVPFSQVTILATWNALGNSRRFLRPIASMFFVLLVWLICFVLPVFLNAIPSEIAIPGIAMFAQWILVQMPLWFVRIQFGWRLETIDQHIGKAASNPVQFGIKHLLIWMTIVGVVLGVARIVLRMPAMHTNAALGFSIFLLCNCLFAWPTVLGSLMNRWLIVALFTAAGIAAMVSVAEPYVFATLRGDRPQQQILLWIANSIQFIWTAISMLVLRQLGFRLVRVGDSS